MDGIKLKWSLFLREFVCCIVLWYACGSTSHFIQRRVFFGRNITFKFVTPCWDNLSYFITLLVFSHNTCMFPNKNESNLIVGNGVFWFPLVFWIDNKTPHILTVVHNLSRQMFCGKYYFSECPVGVNSNNFRLLMRRKVGIDWKHIRTSGILDPLSRCF
jgi:hypothetical protein